MTKAEQKANFNQMSDALQLAIDTGNKGLAGTVIENARLAYAEGALDDEQIQELNDDVSNVGWVF